MYFQNNVHQKNFQLICNERILAAQSDSEYRVAAYILAIPEIFNQSFSDPYLSSAPFLWAVKYEEIQEVGSNGETITSWELILMKMIMRLTVINMKNCLAVIKH